jgi:hypothetical protein
MNSRTRRFLLGSSIVMVVGLCTGLVAYYNGTMLFSRDAAGPSELAYVPSDASAVAFADVRAIMDSEFRQKLKKLLPTGEGTDELKTELGVDIERDIDTVCAGFVAGGPAVSGAIVMVRGRFNDATIESLATRHGAKLETYNGKRLLLHSEFPGTGEAVSIHGEGPHVQVEKSIGAIAFLEPGLIALGDSVAIKKGIDAAASRKNVTANTSLMTYIGDVERTSNAWVVGQFDAITKSQEIPEEVRARMPAVQWFSFSARVNGGLSGSVRADTLDDKAAEDLRQMVNGGLAAARFMTNRDPKLESLLSALQVSGTGKTVAVAFTISPEILDLLVSLASGGLGTMSPIGR